MTFPKSRILSTQQLVRQIIESNRNGERFCFILGSGASVESGIPSGGALEMRWMDCIMGKEDDSETPAMDANVMRQCAKNLYEEKLIEHSFEEIEVAWNEAKKNGGKIASVYYFDIYKLRFYPNQRNGYRYLERIMETCEPSLGYHTLALLLTSSVGNNLVITTNFDSLIEDALFLYTDKKPLVVGHESLAGYIESDIQRPIIAKVHRGLMYAPFNSPDTTQKIKDEWREALNYAFSTYTPIVIGYGGGDHSLMAFLEEKNTIMRHGLYWCYRDASGLPEKNIQDFLVKKDGYLVNIGGFDALMMEIGDSLYKNKITPTGTKDYLEKQYSERVRQYNKQWDKLNKKPELQEVLQPMNEVEQLEEKKREEKEQLMPWDYVRRGDRFYDEERYQDAVGEYTKAINMDSNNTTALCNLSAAYNCLKQYKKAIEECEKVLQIDPNESTAYNNRGFAYGELMQYEKAIEDYTKAIEIDLNEATYFINRGNTFCDIKQYEKAIDDYTKAIKLDPERKSAYRNRAKAYRAVEKVTLAEIDEKHITEM